MAKTISQLTQEVITEMSLVAGTGVQTYSENIVKNKVIDTFKMVFPKVWWEDYMQWFVGDTDGVNGWLTVSLADIQTKTNIKSVMRDGSRPVRQLSGRVAPTASRTFGWYPVSARHADAARIIGFAPVDRVYTIHVHARVPPAEYADSTTLYLDDLMLKYGAAWMYAEDLGVMPAQAQKFQGLFDSRFRQLRGDREEIMEYVNPYSPDPLYDWH